MDLGISWQIFILNVCIRHETQNRTPVFDNLYPRNQRRDRLQTE